MEGQGQLLAGEISLDHDTIYSIEVKSRREARTQADEMRHLALNLPISSQITLYSIHYLAGYSETKLVNYLLMY